MHDVDIMFPLKKKEKAVALENLIDLMTNSKCAKDVTLRASACSLSVLMPKLLTANNTFLQF